MSKNSECLMKFSSMVFLIIVVVMLFSASSFAYTLSGDIDGGVWFGGITYIYAVSLEFTGGIPEFAIGLALFGTGPYSILGVDEGNYILFAYQDRDYNLIPSAEDYFGYYGTWLPEIVAVSGNMNNMDIEIAPLPVTLIEGSVAYGGSSEGLTLMEAASDPDFENVEYFSILLDFTGNGDYIIFAEPGDYYVRSYMDVDFSFTYNVDDPMGYYGFPDAPQIVSFGGGGASGIDITMYDPMDLSVSLNPLGGPIVVPAQGGSFEYEITLENHGESIAVFDVWTEALLPSGTTYGPILQRTVSLNAGGQLFRQMTQSVPEAAPAGAYTYRAFVGDYPSLIIDDAGFDFEKSSAYDHSEWSESWNISGWYGEPAADILPVSCHVSPAYPNPFNSVTEFAFQLAEPEKVKVSLYDVQGRMIEKLTEGTFSAGQHTVGINMQGHSSGIYFIRLSAGNTSYTQKLIFQK